jgi:ADP-ribose pyrophosphatase
VKESEQVAASTARRRGEVIAMRVLSTKSIYKGKMIDVTVDEVVEPRGVRARREVVRHGGSVVVLPRLALGRVLLVRQFRYAAGRSLWELVAGGIEPGESPLRAAARELREETGYRAAAFRPIFQFYPSPGILSEKMYLFEATRLRQGTAQPDSDERIETRAFSLPELRKMLSERKIPDGKTLIGLLWLFGHGKRS